MAQTLSGQSVSRDKSRDHINTRYARPPWAELILQPFRHFTYITTHSPTLPSLYLRHSSFSNPSVASPTSQFILHPFFCFSYVTAIHLTLIVPRGWQIGSKQPRIKCQKNSATHFVYFWSRKTPPIHIWNNLHKLQKQGQNLHIWMTSLSTTDCYKN